jgi:hypothetical protein
MSADRARKRVLVLGATGVPRQAPGGGEHPRAANCPHDPRPDLLPGFALIGFGIGLAFAAITVAAMSEIAADTAGLASGLLTTGHELGAALGASIVSAIAFGSGAGSFVVGYGHGALAGAAIAATLALVSLVAMPTTRAATVPQLAMH